MPIWVEKNTQVDSPPNVANMPKRKYDSEDGYDSEDDPNQDVFVLTVGGTVCTRDYVRSILWRALEIPTDVAAKQKAVSSWQKNSFQPLFVREKPVTAKACNFTDENGEFYKRTMLFWTCSRWLSTTVREQKQMESDGSQFTAAKTPQFSIGDYVIRLWKYSKASSLALVSACVYMLRISIKINALSVHRLFLTALLFSAKMNDDIRHANGYYAKIGGISNGEMNKLEVEMLMTLKKHAISVSAEEYDTMEAILINSMTDDEFNEMNNIILENISQKVA